MNHLHGIFSQIQTSPLHIRIRWLRWLTPLGVLALAALHQAGLHYLISTLPESWHIETELIIYGLTGSLVAWAGLTRLAELIESRAEADARLRLAYSTLEARHQKLLTLQDYGRKLASAGSEQAVFELAAQAPLQLSEAKGSTVITFNPEKEQLKLDMAWGLSDSYLRALRTRIESGIPAARCRECTVLKTESTSDCPLFDGLHQAARAEGIGGLLCLPMMLEQERVGILSVYYPSPAGPPEDQLRLLNILSGTIGAMLESLRLRTIQAQTNLPVQQLDSSSAAIDSAFGDFARQVLKIMLDGWAATTGGLFLFDEATSTWNCPASHELGTDLTDPRFDLALEMARQAQASGRLVILPELPPGGPETVLSAAAAPLVTDGHFLGAIFLGADRRRAFSNRHSEFLKTMSHQIALAVWNTQLYEQIDQSAVIKERYRLSREIHDGLAQTLAYLGLQTETLEKLVAAGQSEEALREIVAMRQSIRSAYTESREAIEGLRLEIENPDDLPLRLREFVAQFNRRTGIQSQVTVDLEDLLVEPAAGLQLLRITQEALSNVRKHAQATRVEISLRVLGHELEMSISDDGRGFPVSSQIDQAILHFGLTTMRERAHSLGGALTVATGPMQGTRITVTVPLAEFKRTLVQP